MNSKKARVTAVWERGPGVEAGRAGFRSCSTLHAVVRHLDFTLMRWKPQNGSELQSDVVCVVTQTPVWPTDSIGGKLPFSFHGEPCSIWAWHFVIFLFIMTCSLWGQAK